MMKYPRERHHILMLGCTNICTNKYPQIFIFKSQEMKICKDQIPFFPLQVKHLLPLVLMFGLYTLGLSSYAVFDRNSFYVVGTQVFTHTFDVDEKALAIFIYAWPCILCQVVSVFTSLLTIRHLSNIRKNPVSTKAGSAAISIRSSIKILITNFSSVLNSIVMVACMCITFAQGKKGGTQSDVLLFITSVLAPVLLSCFNPIVFITFTPKFSLKPKPTPSSLQSV